MKLIVVKEPMLIKENVTQINILKQNLKNLLNKLKH